MCVPPYHSKCFNSIYALLAPTQGSMQYPPTPKKNHIKLAQLQQVKEIFCKILKTHLFKLAYS